MGEDMDVVVDGLTASHRLLDGHNPCSMRTAMVYASHRLPDGHDQQCFCLRDYPRYSPPYHGLCFLPVTQAYRQTYGHLPVTAVTMMAPGAPVLLDSQN